MTEEPQSVSIAPLPVRSPLHTQTNVQATVLPPSPDKVRRKSSFVRRLDSSEDLPSSHDSIFAAEYLSPYNSEDSGSGYKLDRWDKPEPQLPQIPLAPRIEISSPTLSAENDENANSRPLSVGITPILYGHGTPLYSIIEQKSSNPTLRESPDSTSEIRTLIRPRSVSDLTNSTVRSHARTGPNPLPNRTFSSSGIIRRLESLSADDSVESIKLSWPSGYDPTRAVWRGKSSMLSDSSSGPGSPINEIYAQPLRPMQPPVLRPETPPGMPSWTAAQQRQPRITNAQGETRRGWGIHEASSMLQRLFSNRSQSGGTAPLPGTPGQFDTPESATNSGYGVRGPWDGVPAHRRTVSAPILRGAPRFRPPRSAHGVARLEMHPFARAPNMDMNAKSDTADMAIPRVSTSEIQRRNSAAARASGSTPFVTVLDPLGSHPVNPGAKPTGKRKPGQRVRFTPSTADPGTISRDSGSSVRPDVKVCPHKHRSSTSSDIRMWDVTPAPLAGAHEANSAVTRTNSIGDAEPMLLNTDRLLVANANHALSMAGDELHLNTDRAPVPDVHHIIPLWSVDGARSPVEGQTVFKARTECWKCRLEGAAEKMDRAWDMGIRFAGWYCCGFEREEMKESRLRSPEVGPRVRGFD